MDAFHFRGMERIELVLVRRRLGQHALGALQRNPECRLQLRIAGDLAANIPDQTAKPGAHFLQPTQALLVAAGVHQPGRFAPRLDHQPGKGLAQLHPVALRQTHQPFRCAQEQMTVGRMRHRLGLNGGVYGDPRQLPLVHCAGLHRHCDRLGENQVHLVRTDAFPPARHRRPVERKPVPEVRLAAERLVIRIFHPDRTKLLVAETLHVLEQMQSDHEPGAQPAAALGLVVIRPKGIVEAIPVDQPGQSDQLVLGVQDRLQRGAKQIVARRLRAFRSHGFSRHRWLSQAVHHNRRRTGIHHAHARAKSQGFGRKGPQTLRIPILDSSTKQIHINALRENHGRRAIYMTTFPKYFHKESYLHRTGIYQCSGPEVSHNRLS